MPVFRYALERWPPSPYEVVVLHRGPLSAPHQALVARLSTNVPTANVVVQTVDLATNASAVRPDLAQLRPTDPLPALVVRYPEGAATRTEIWRGPLAEDSLSQLLDSPMRRRIVQRLLKGDCGVWLLLESGATAQDTVAAHLLQTRIEHLQKTLQIPKLDAEDITNRVISVAEAELKVAFSFLRLSRSDPAEAFFVRMLLGSEDDLAESREPMAFPIFGRGRLLFALVGKGINLETVDDACSFLVGPCSCVVKEENPGVDLLLSADWDNLVRASSTADRAEPELTGFSAFLNESNRTRTAAGPPQADAARARAALTAAPAFHSLYPGPASNRPTVLKTVLLIVIGLGALALIGGTLLLLRRKG